MARHGLLALARLLLLTPSVSAQTCALLRSHLPSNAHRAREQPVAHCRLSAHLPVRLALVRAVSRTSHSVSHGVGHGVTHSVTHSVSHGVSHGFSTAVAADVRAGGAACVHHLCHDSHATHPSPHAPIALPPDFSCAPVSGASASSHALPRTPASVAHAAPLTHVRRPSKGH